MESVVWEGIEDERAKEWAIAMPYGPLALAAFALYGRVVVRLTGRFMEDGRQVVEVHREDQVAPGAA